MTAHWGLPDPAAVEGDEVDRMMAFRQALLSLENRVSVFVSLPIETLDRLRLKAALEEIGQLADGAGTTAGR